MNLFRQLRFLLLAMAVGQACKPSQLEPSTENSVSTKANVSVDSLIKVVIPDFATIVRASVTPKGKLDYITIINQNSDSSIENSVTTNLLYDSKQRISGFTNLDSPSKGVDNACIYEYENDKPARIFSKAINPNQPIFYFMEQWVYGVNNHPKACLLYRVELDGKARLLSRNSYIYNPANQLTEIKDANGYHMGQLFEYVDNNLRTIRHKLADGTLSVVRSEYQYDNKPNILKGVFWRSGPEYIDYNLSDNNLINKVTRDEQTVSISSEYTTQYDSQDRLIRRQVTAPHLGSITEYYFFGK